MSSQHGKRISTSSILANRVWNESISWRAVQIAMSETWLANHVAVGADVFRLRNVCVFLTSVQLPGYMKCVRNKNEPYVSAYKNLLFDLINKYFFLYCHPQSFSHCRWEHVYIYVLFSYINICFKFSFTATATSKLFFMQTGWQILTCADLNYLEFQKLHRFCFIR